MEIRSSQIGFRQFLTESQDSLDVSTQDGLRYLNSKVRIEEFLNTPVKIEHKIKGQNLTIIKVADNGDFNDWVIANKGNILYKEYDYQSLSRIKSECTGISQFRIVTDHFSNLGHVDIPTGTELLVKFVMRSSMNLDYKKYHKMILLGSSISKYHINFGKLKTENTGLDLSHRDEYAKILGIDTPEILFNGVLGSEFQFEQGIVNKELGKLFSETRNSMNWTSPEILLQDIRHLLLSVESGYGLDDILVFYNNRVLEFLRDCVDIIPANNSTEYLSKVKSKALELYTKVKYGRENELPDLLSTLSIELKYMKLDFCEENKSFSIRDDIQEIAKNLIIKNLRGNNNCLILGEFRVVTKAHYKMIRRAIRIFDNVVVCIISNSKNRHTAVLRTNMIYDTFPGVRVIYHNDASLLSIIEKSPININSVYTGTDKINDYIKQLQDSNVGVREYTRDGSSISATKVIENIQDSRYFKNNTPEITHRYYSEIVDLYTGRVESSVSETDSSDIAPVDNKLGTSKIKRICEKCSDGKCDECVRIIKNGKLGNKILKDSI